MIFDFARRPPGRSGSPIVEPDGRFTSPISRDSPAFRWSAPLARDRALLSPLRGQEALLPSRQARGSQPDGSQQCTHEKHVRRVPGRKEATTNQATGEGAEKLGTRE